MTDRINAPQLLVPKVIHLEQPECINLKDGAPIYIIKSGTQDVMKIELLFDAGSRFYSHPMIASVANELIDEGTSKKNSAEIATLFDYYGAFLQTECTVDYASISLFTLNRFLDPTLSLLVEMLNDVQYPQEEVSTFILQEKQRLAVNLEKVDFLSRKHFNASLYPEHIYGYFPKLEDYDSIERESVQSFYRNCYQSGLKAVIISGKVNDEDQNLLLNRLNSLVLFPSQTTTSSSTIAKQSPVHKHVEKSGAVQNAIRIGRRLFNRKHPDYPKLTVLNTILGGYFGSRLMANIREDKGFTYGIHSGLVSLSDDGYFYIATEVGSEVCDAALKEIYFEVVQLQEHLVQEEELSLVKNYLLGSFQRSIDGPFALSERFKTVLLSGLNYDYFINYLDIVKNITSDDLLTLARKYLSPSEMTQISIGQK